MQSSLPVAVFQCRPRVVSWWIGKRSWPFHRKLATCWYHDSNLSAEYIHGKRELSNIWCNGMQQHLSRIFSHERKLPKWARYAMMFKNSKPTKTDQDCIFLIFWHSITNVTGTTLYFDRQVLSVLLSQIRSTQKSSFHSCLEYCTSAKKRNWQCKSTSFDY